MINSRVGQILLLTRGKVVGDDSHRLTLPLTGFSMLRDIGIHIGLMVYIFFFNGIRADDRGAGFTEMVMDDRSAYSFPIMHSVHCHILKELPVAF